MKPTQIARIVEADFTWFERELVPRLQVEILDDGTIGRVGATLAKPEAAVRLEGQALFPGMVNAHSHAFQRGLRGKAETRTGATGTFWSWREEMYRLVDALDPERFQRLTALAFREMIAAGITTVGEFHYFHHPAGSRGYELDRAVVEAAREAGIRLVLLDVCYMTGDVGKPLEGAQLRFQSRSVDEYLESTEKLDALLDRPTQSLGLVAHSIRAVPLEGIVELHRAAVRRGLVFHMHLEEQEREIEAALAHYGKRPLELVMDKLDVGPELTAVHCTHSREQGLDRLLATGANVCICPLTEANLADGIPPARLTDPGANLSLGTDSNLRIDFQEEMRLLEYGQRLRAERRGIFAGASGSVAARLFEIATEGGARSLGVRAGRIATGYAADFLTLDLGASSLEETDPAQLLPAFVLGAGREAICSVAVAGVWTKAARSSD
jgi:formimidoylglutamate deiminase